MHIDVLDPGRYIDGLPHDQYAWLREHAPCHRVAVHDPQLLDDAWVVSRYADVRAVDRDGARFLNGSGVSMRREVPPEKPNVMIAMDGQDHAENRKVISACFTRRVVKTFEQHFRDLAKGIVDRAVAKEEFDFVTDVAVELPMHAIFDLLGVPKDDDRYRLLGLANTFVSPTDPDIAASPEESLAAAAELSRYGLTLAELRRRDPGDDVMSQIVQAVDAGELDDAELMGFTFLLIAAGTETTRNAISIGVHALAEHPDELHWLRDHTDALPDTVVEEILRWSSPVIFMRRTAATDLELHGEQVRAGERVVMLYASANFDPEEFVDPHRFDLRRSPNHHLALGSGPHFCLGAHVARIELRVLFEELFRRVGAIELRGPITFARNSFGRVVKRLPVAVTPS